MVDIDVDRVSGKFASRDEIEEALITMIEGANEGSVSGVGADGDSEYEISDWTVGNE